MSDPAAAPVARTVSIDVSAASGAFAPRVVVVAGSEVTFVNYLATPMVIRAAGSSLASFSVSAGPKASGYADANPMSMDRRAAGHRHAVGSERMRSLLRGKVVASRSS